LSTVDGIYEGWRRVQDHLVARIPRLSTEELGLTGAPDGWPIWALVAHLSGTRVYWLCTIAGEPGVETTPFPEPAIDGWEDHLDHPRSAEELLDAVRSSGAIVERCLNEWTPDMLAIAFTRVRKGETQRHTRASILTRTVMHDSFHAGEISLLLGSRGLQSLDPWDPLILA